MGSKLPKVTEETIDEHIGAVVSAKDSGNFKDKSNTIFE